MKHVPFLMLLFLPLFALPAMIVTGSGPLPDGPVLVVSAWGTETEAQIVSAGGRVIGPQSAPFGVFATSETPDFPNRLRASGAWAVINGARLAAICGVDT